MKMLGGPHTPCGGSRGESMSLPFPGSGDHRIPWLTAPSAIFKAATQHLNLTFCFCCLTIFSRPGPGVKLWWVTLGRNHFPPTGFLQSMCSQSNCMRKTEKARKLGPCYFSVSQHLPSPQAELSDFTSVISCVSWKIELSIILNGQNGRTLFTLLPKKISFLVLFSSCTWSQVLNSQVQGWVRKLMSGATMESFMLKAFIGLPSVSWFSFSFFK